MSASNPQARDDFLQKIRSAVRARVKKIPGAVNSPVHAWKAVRRSPLFIEGGEGTYLFDADGNRFIDYVGSYGPTISGHANSEITAAVEDSLIPRPIA